MMIVGILLKNIPYNFGQFGRLECGDGEIIDSINDIDDIDEHSSWKRSVADDGYGQDIVVKRSVIHIENITHVNINISAADLSLCDSRYIGHELDPFISRSLVTAALTILFLVAGLELEPGQLWEQSGLFVRACLIPGITEASSVAILSHFLLGKCMLSDKLMCLHDIFVKVSPSQSATCWGSCCQGPPPPSSFRA